MTDNNLNIVIAGVPPGVKVGVFNENAEKRTKERTILLQEAENSEYIVTKSIPKSFAGTPVKVVIRSYGFLPREFITTIDSELGLYHAARLDIDRNVSPPTPDVPDGWNAQIEHRKAETKIQDLITDAKSTSPNKTESTLQAFASKPITSKEFKSVFISYGGPDEFFAKKIQEALTKEGVETFFFPEDAKPGEKLHRVMRKGVNEYDRVVLICSESSLNRPGVVNEIEEVLSRESREGGTSILIPITIDNYVFDTWSPANNDIGIAVRDKVVADFRSAVGSEIEFAKALGRLLGVLEQIDRTEREDSSYKSIKTDA